MPRIAWAKAYRPKAVKDFIFQDEAMKALVLKFIEEQNVPDLLLSGHHGTGKSSLVQVLRHELHIDDMDYLYINASLDNSIDTIRTKVVSFINTFAMSEVGFKLVYLDEADRLTQAAQDSLKSLIEDYEENTRFILTCNKPQKIIEPLHSRCQQIVFKTLDKEAVYKRAVRILKKEGVNLEKDETLDLVDKYIDATYPDFRKLLNVLQQHTINGELTDGEVETGGATEANLTMLEMMENNQWGKIRSYMAENTPDGTWEEVYRFLYDYIGDVPAFDNAAKLDEAIITIADHLYKQNFMADAEINFAACIIKLARIAKR